MLKIMWIKGEEKWSVISVKVMVKGERWNKGTKRDSIHNEEYRTKNRTYCNTAQAGVKGKKTINSLHLTFEQRDDK